MKRWLWLVPLLLAAIVYAPAPSGGTVWDDDSMFERVLPRFRTIGDALAPPDDMIAITRAYYRPVVFMSLMMDRSLHGKGLGIAGFHLSNVLYHIMATFFVWLLACRLLGRRKNTEFGALVAATLFAVHPIHVETVSWIAGRTDLLAAMFTLPSLLLALRWRDKGATWALILGALFYLLGLLSKEVALATLILVPATLFLAPKTDSSEAMVPGDDKERHTSTALMWLGIAIAYLGVTFLYLSLRQSVVTGPGAIHADEIVSHLVRSTGYYLFKVLIPWPQSGFVTWEMTPGVVAGMLAVLLAFGLTVLGVRSWIRHREGLLLYSMLWFGAALGPSLVIAISPMARTPVAERYLYLPSVAIALLAGAAVTAALATRWRKQTVALFVVIIGIYGLGTFQRGFIWHDNVSFWTDTSAKVQKHPIPWVELGHAHLKVGKPDKALEYFQRALQVVNTSGTDDHRNSDVSAMIYNNIGIIYRDERNFAAAEQHFITALEKDPALPNPYYNLGTIYSLKIGPMVANQRASRDERDKLFNKAINAYRMAVMLDPDLPMARWLLSGVLLGHGQILEADGDMEQSTARYQDSLDQVEQLIARNPENQYDPNMQAQRQELKAALDRLSQATQSP